MASNDNEDFCIAGSSNEGKVQVNLVAKFLLNFLSLAT